MAEAGGDKNLIALSDDALNALSDRAVVPSYDRSKLTPGIVHIGLGNFHRAHQAWYIHRLMQAGQAHDWAIIGAGVRPADAIQRSRLSAQDWLTTLIELDASGTSAEVTGPMIDFVPVEETNAGLIDRMAAPDIRIVTLTVTEGGYYVDPATGAFDAKHPDIQHDAAHPEKPRTAFGAMIAALKRRRADGIGPFTALSCDNLQGNGRLLRQTVLSLAGLVDADLADWIAEACTFPNSMVDCIVPATGPGEIALARDFGLQDSCPVTHESFRQWVVEDAFCVGRPPLEHVGVTFSPDVHAYETMKIRILNGGHQIIANSAELLGIRTIADAMAHPQIAGLLRKVVTDEVAPNVAPVPGCPSLDYLAQIERRFSNSAIADTTRRVAFDGSSRHPGFIVPSIREGLSRGTPTNGLAFVSAAWARYCIGIREDGSAIADNDPNWKMLNARAQAARKDPSAWLAMSEFYGDLSDHTGFAGQFSDWLNLIHAKGLRTALQAYLAE
ncbi:MAG: mannitol dehydrogenase family protein [Pseudomonadota bacterium]